jgi:hypothetical protein
MLKVFSLINDKQNSVGQKHYIYGVPISIFFQQSVGDEHAEEHTLITQSFYIVLHSFTQLQTRTNPQDASTIIRRFSISDS